MNTGAFKTIYYEFEMRIYVEVEVEIRVRPIMVKLYKKV